MGNPIESLFIKVFEGAASLMRAREKPDISKGALLIGAASHLYQPKRKENMHLSVSERLQHLYILGATGTGKSKLLEFLIRQDILAGRGLCFIDPHGDLYQNILDFLAGCCLGGNDPEMSERISKRLVLIDPACTEWAMGFNPLEAVGVNPYSQALEFMGILKKIWSDAYWGPRMEELMRNTMVTLSLHGYTLLETKKIWFFSRLVVESLVNF